MRAPADKSTSSRDPKATPSQRSGVVPQGAAALQLKAALRGRSYDEQVQVLSPGPEGDAARADIHQKAKGGLTGGGGAMPHREAIQRSFGGYDVSNIIAHTDASAKDAAASMGADAYATGDHIVLGDKGQSLHTVAHEAAHIIQQRAGVQLKGGVGEVGDTYERHADAVADRVVQGKSAEDLLDRFAGGGGSHATQRRGVQRRTGGAPTQMSVDPVGAIIGAAAFTMSAMPNPSSGLTQTNVLSRYLREGADARAANARRIRLNVLELWAHISMGSSDAKFQLDLHTDGDNIFAANTEMTERNGFSGGMFGSSASVTWNATAYSGPRDRPTSILLTCSGNVDPSGAGYCDYHFSILVKGDGTVVRQGGRVMNVSGNMPATMSIRPSGSGYTVGNERRAAAAGNQNQPSEDGR